MKKKKSNKEKFSFFAIYTVIFCVMLYAVFYWFFKTGTTFINAADAYRQHLKALVYISKWMRGIVYRIFVEHKLDIQMFSFGIGYGGDILNTLQYYGIGDFLNLPAILVPTDYMYIYFQIVELVRPYLAGLAFGFLCLYLKPEASKSGVMAGMLTYSFCSFYLYLGIWHPFFENPFIYFPLVILGAEKLLRENKKAFFAFSIFLAGTNNFLFFYMIVAMAIVYVIVRAAFINGRNIKGWGETFKRFLISGGVGGLMTLVIMLPIIIMFPDNPRVDITVKSFFAYDFDYYVQMVKNYFSFVDHGKFDVQMGYHGIALFTLFLFQIKTVKAIKNRESMAEKMQMHVMLIIMTIFLCMPAFGYALTGFAFITNRWIFAFTLFISYLIVYMWDDFFSMDKKELAATVIFAAAFTVLCGALGILNEANPVWELCLMAVGIVVSAIVSFFASNKEMVKRAAGIIMAILVTLGILINSHFAYAPDELNIVKDYLSQDEDFHVLLESTEIQAVQEAVEEDGLDVNGFYRYTGRNLVWNASLIYGISSTQFFWSLANGVTSDFLQEMGVNDEQSFAYFALDDREILNALAGVRYYSLRYNTDEEHRYLPYDYYHMHDRYNFAIFENPNPLSLGYTYHNVIPKNDYAAMLPVQRQEALLYGVVLEEDDYSYPEAEINYSYNDIPYSISYEGDIAAEDGKWTAKGGSRIHITFNGNQNCETYFYIANLWAYEASASPGIQVEAYSDGELITKKRIPYKTEENEFYSDWHNYIVNMGYAANAKDEIVLEIEEDGVYTFDDIRIYCQPMGSYESRIPELSKEQMLNIDFHKNPVSFATNTVTGDVTLEDDGILCITIPHSSGWDVYADGVKDTLYKANTAFMGVKLSKGYHTIELKYHTPGLRAGFILTIAGFVLWILLIKSDRRLKKADAL